MYLSHEISQDVPCPCPGSSDQPDHVTCAFCGMELAGWPAMESQEEVDRIHLEMSEG